MRGISSDAKKEIETVPQSVLKELSGRQLPFMNSGHHGIYES